jgi:uncharacterized membrane protein
VVVREQSDLSFALSVILLGLLMMISRRNAVSQVVGFMALENGLMLAATGAKGMPLVVEISVAFSVLIAFIVIGIFLFRIRERFDTVDVQALDRFRGNAKGIARWNLAAADVPGVAGAPKVKGARRQKCEIKTLTRKTAEKGGFRENAIFISIL